MFCQKPPNESTQPIPPSSFGANAKCRIKKMSISFVDMCMSNRCLSLSAGDQQNFLQSRSRHRSRKPPSADDKQNSLQRHTQTHQVNQTHASQKTPQLLRKAPERHSARLPRRGLQQRPRHSLVNFIGQDSSCEKCQQRKSKSMHEHRFM